jgi:hypothetical protein
MNAVSVLVGGVIPAEAAGCCGRAADQANALVPVRVINVDLADPRTWVVEVPSMFDPVQAPSLGHAFE